MGCCPSSHVLRVKEVKEMIDKVRKQGQMTSRERLRLGEIERCTPYATNLFWNPPEYLYSNVSYGVGIKAKDGYYSVEPEWKMAGVTSKSLAWLMANQPAADVQLYLSDWNDLVKICGEPELKQTCIIL